MKITLGLIVILILALVVSGQAVERKYDRFKDETTVKAIIGDVPMDLQYRSVTWAIVASYTGSEIPTSPKIQLILTTSSKTSIIGGANPELRMIVDGKRELVGELKHVAIPVRETILESASLWVELATLRRWGSAKVVETQAGQFEWKFSDEGLARIREFISVFEKKAP